VVVLFTQSANIGTHDVTTDNTVVVLAVTFGREDVVVEATVGEESAVLYEEEFQ
jgi:hypothetical protein